MATSKRHIALPVLMLLLAGAQTQFSHAAEPLLLAQMDHSMHGMDHSMHMSDKPSILPTDSNNGLFKGSVTSEVEPVVINKLHSWTLFVTTADGKPVEDATITVSGTMPAHAHGMPTSPQVTANLGGGNYKVEGMQFQMGGDWEVVFNVTSGAQKDDIVFKFKL